ncbi:amine oxidase [Plakobranchus ocellatus]|uniref:Amine oxidase n=1 Tax=Plakobranchus ocellatus TaxID=259542 RepID=A0AAV3YD46_9GAST|nr:amine oxidase [Plakobranchus ocellatus]
MATGVASESLVRLLNSDDISDDDNHTLYGNGHNLYGRALKNNLRHIESPRKTCRRVSILSTVLGVSLSANLLLCLLLYRGGDTTRPDFSDAISLDAASKLSISCNLQNASSPQTPPPSTPQIQEENSGQTVSCSNNKDNANTFCSKDHQNLRKLRAEAKKYQNVFEDLSAQEIQGVYDYLKKQSDLLIRPYGDDSGNHIYSIELHVPNKTTALLFLQGRGPRPAREAQIVLERPHTWSVPFVQELVVGPLPRPTYHRQNSRRESRSVPYRFHPSYGTSSAYKSLAQKMSPSFHAIIRESYGAGFVDCQSRCLVMLSQKTSSAYSDRTLIVLTAYYSTDFVTINPLDLMFVMKETRKDSNQFDLDSMEYAGQTFESIEAFVVAYRQRTTPRVRKTFPDPVSGESSNPGTMDLRGQKFPDAPQQGPRQFEPEGKRYIVDHQHIRYMEWSFNVRMSTASGPQVWDVRWAGERIAYEISLQDVAVIYAGANPTTFYAHLSDSAFGLGDKAYGLMPGVDCPEHATFLPVTVYNQTRNGPKVHPNAFCIFEHNNGVPLRRHRSDDPANGRNFGGLVDRVLIVRTVLVEYNYDYIFDIVFHLNGAIEITSHATGYVMSQHYRTAEKPFGFRYKTLDFITDKRRWPWLHDGQRELEQIAFSENLKQTENEALLHYNFSQPKYHLVFNNAQRNKFGHHRAYRILSNGFSSQILPDDSVVLKSRAWSKYQMMVTERKEKEETSSSIFSMFDGASPHVNIEKYLSDNGSIVDKDLVLWVTIGFHHIPHTEDIPNTPTVGARATVSLLPYNYFPECPSVGSRDAIRIDAKGDKLHPKYSFPQEKNCLPQPFQYQNFLSRRSNMFP